MMRDVTSTLAAPAIEQREKRAAACPLLSSPTQGPHRTHAAYTFHQAGPLRTLPRASPGPHWRGRVGFAWVQPAELMAEKCAVERGGGRENDSGLSLHTVRISDLSSPFPVL
jgi:hypothetical protein